MFGYRWEFAESDERPEKTTACEELENGYTKEMLFLWVFVFLFGTVVGSFLNAVIYRTEKGGSAFQGRSYCPHCKHQLSWRDLIPLLSFILLRGQCRYCHLKISWQYPLVELSTGVVFLFIFFSYGGFALFFSIDHIFRLAYVWGVTSLLIIIFVYDLKHFLIPDTIVYGATGLALLYHLLEFENLENFVSFWIAALFASGFFLAIFLGSRGRWMGLGDVKLAFFMGLFLGWPNVLVALFVAFVIGAGGGLVLIATRRKNLTSEVPFGPFLIAGTLVALLWGKDLVDWYLNLILV
ncbi:MAG: prepilin peptidase [Patescibacteria group bacterium]